jgi:hypothetical protein
MGDITGTVRVTGKITPTNTDDRFATHDALFGKGGWRNVDTLAERNDISDERRRAGMVVVVDEDGKAYMLKPAPWAYDDTDWEEFGFGGGAGEGNTIHVLSGQTITINQYRQSLVFGDVVVDGGGTLVIDGELRIINGVLSVEAGGVVELNGSLVYEQVVVPSDLLVYVPVNIGSLFNGAYLQYNQTTNQMDAVSLSLNVVDGTEQGQTLHWDTGTSMYQPSSNLMWDESSTTLYVGGTGGMLMRDRNGSVHIGFSAGNGGDGNGSVFIGRYAGIGSAYSDSVAVGEYALGRVSRFASNSVAVGRYAGYNEYVSGSNVFVGSFSGYSVSSSSNSVFIGRDAGYSCVSGSDNVYIGYSAGANANPSNNVCIGSYAGYNLGSPSDGFSNVCIGTNAGRNGRYNYNVIIGHDAFSGSIGAQGQGIYIGGFAGSVATSIQQVAVMGYQAGQYNQSNYNTFIGHRAGRYNTTGDRNTVIGWESGATQSFGYNLGSGNTIIGAWNARASQGTASYNTVIGYACAYYLSGQYNTIGGFASGASLSSGSNNTLFGAMSGYSMSTGSNAVIIGNYAGYLGSENSACVFLGTYAGYSNAAGYANVFLGAASGYGNTDGFYNVFVGNNAGYFNSTGFYNVFVGNNAGYLNTIGIGNNFFGSATGYSNTSGSNNTAVGNSALYLNSTGYGNVAIGSAALGNTNGATENAAVGTGSMLNNVTGSRNAVVGNLALQNDSAGNENVVMGAEAGLNCAGSGNVFLGFRAGYNETGSNRLYITNTASNLGSPLVRPLVYGEFDNEKLWLNGALYYDAPNSEPASADLYNGQVVAWLDETASPPYIVFKVKMSNGVVKNGALALS